MPLFMSETSSSFPIGQEEVTLLATWHSRALHLAHKGTSQSPGNAWRRCRVLPGGQCPMVLHMRPMDKGHYTFGKIYRTAERSEP